MLTAPHHLRYPRALARAALTVAVVSTSGLGAVELAAQTARTASIARRIPVYIVDFRLLGSLPPELGQLHVTASEMMRLGLLEVPRVSPVRTREAPPCGSPGPAAQVAVPGGGAGNFYVVRGLISARGDEVLLDYALEQCGSDTVLTTIGHETEPLPRPSLLEGLSRAARYVSTLTRRQLPRPTVAVLRFMPANPRDTNEVAAAALVEQELLSAVWASSDFEVAEATNARYRLSGRVALRPPAAPGGSRFRSECSCTPRHRNHCHP